MTDSWINQLFFHVEKDGQRRIYQEPSRRIAPEMTDVFYFTMVEGDAAAVHDPEKILMPESMARKIFGTQSAIGKLLIAGEKTFTVGGVYKDFPKNSSLTNILYYSLEDENLHSWENFNYSYFIRLDRPENVDGLIENFKNYFNRQKAEENGFSFNNTDYTFRIVPLTDLHFCGQVLYDTTPKTSPQILFVLFTIGILIVVIAGINFTNFSTALAPMRIKTINTQKVLGETTSRTRKALLIEAVSLCILSYLLALLLVFIAKDTQIATLVDTDISLKNYPYLLFFTFILAVGTGLLAGLYPAFYMTSFQPALVLKGTFGLSPQGRKLRSLLIGIQYVASFALIIGAMFMYLQNHYMHHTPLGYDKDALIVTNLNQKVRKSYQAFASQLKNFAEIEDVTFAETLLSSADQYMNWGCEFRDMDINYQCLPVDPGFLKVLGIKINDGRDFQEGDMKTTHGVYIFNESARNKYNFQLNDRIDSTEIVGFIPDIKFASFRMEVTPMAFFVWGKTRWGKLSEDRYYQYAYIKVKGSAMGEAMDHVRSTLKTFDPEYPFNVRFFDSVLNALYTKEQRLSKLITIFSLLAVFISIVGVFGLVVFDSEYRRKEIGVRKVLGSTTAQIIILFNKTYIRILCICFVVAVPMAWYGISQWLKNFAYKIPMYMWVYILAFLLIGLITLLTVTFQNWRTANENPVHSIKSE